MAALAGALTQSLHLLGCISSAFKLIS